MGQAAGFSPKNHSDPARRGERVAGWLEGHLRASGSTLAEVAFRIRQDKRDLERLVAHRSCGHRLEDALAAHFGWPFVEAVMAPVIEESIGAEIARERAEIAAREDRLARLERAAEARHPVYGVVHPEARSWAAPSRVKA